MTVKGFVVHALLLVVMILPEGIGSVPIRSAGCLKEPLGQLTASVTMKLGGIVGIGLESTRLTFSYRCIFMKRTNHIATRQRRN